MTIFLPKAHIYVTENLSFWVPVRNTIKLKSKTHLKEHFLAQPLLRFQSSSQPKCREAK